MLELNRSNYEDARVELQDNTEEKIRKSIDPFKDKLSIIDDKISDMSDSIDTELVTFKLWADMQFNNFDTKLSVLLFLFFINIVLSAFILIKLGLE